MITRTSIKEEFVVSEYIEITVTDDYGSHPDLLDLEGAEKLLAELQTMVDKLKASKEE